MKLLKEIKKDLEKWKTLQISLLRRIAAIRMNILPKILFLFQNIPMGIFKAFFKELNKEIHKFIWNNRRTRIKLRALQDKKERAGLALPDWQLYHQACVLTWLKKWIKLENDRLLMLEGHNLQLGWHAFLKNGKTINILKTMR